MTIECPKCLLIFDVTGEYAVCPNCDTELIISITARENEDEQPGNLEKAQSAA